MVTVDDTGPAEPAEERLRGQNRLRSAFLVAFSVQILLMVLAFSVSSVLQQSNTKLSQFGDIVSGHLVQLHTISELSQEITREAAQTHRSSTFIKAMQSELSKSINALKSCTVFSNEKDSTPRWFETTARNEIIAIRNDIEPAIDRMLKRSVGLANASEDEITERFTNLSTIDVVSAASGSVSRGLERIIQISKRSSEAIASQLYLLNTVINSLSILMIIFVGFIIIRPALRAQLNAIEREREISSELRKSVDQLRQAEYRALQLYEEAKEADRVKTEFLAVMSHELRTPLNAINGFSEVLANELFGNHAVPQYKEYAQDIHSSGIHLLSIINDILDFSRMDMRSVEIFEQQIDLDDTLRTVSRMLIPDAQNSEVTLAPRVEHTDACALYGDPKLVQQAVLNVAANAIKFSMPGGTVFISRALQFNGDLHITVSDQGVGIPQDLLAKVVLPFTQAEGAFARSKGGLGLGLAITSAIMNAHGGRVVIDSVIDKGTTVRLVFPAERVTATDISVPARLAKIG
jgi:signal transduction histidine kinase